MKATIKPLYGDQGLAFQPYALQIVLFRPFAYEPTIMCGSLQIVPLQLAPSVGKAYAAAQAVEQKVIPSFPAARCHILTKSSTRGYVLKR